MNNVYKNFNKQIEGGWRMQIICDRRIKAIYAVIRNSIGCRRNHEVIFGAQGRDKRKLRKAGWIK